MRPANRNTRNARPKSRHASTRTRTPQRVGNVRTSGGTHRAPKSRTLDKQVVEIPIERGKMIITRRHLIYGAVAVVAVAAVGVGSSALKSATSSQEDEEVSVLDVKPANVTTADDIQQVEATSCVSQIGDYKLTYGTMVWCNDDDLAVCLVPCDTGKPLNKIDLLWLGSGNTATLLEQAAGTDDGFEILDVRATSNGIIWVESDILEGAWRIYTATLTSGGTLGTAVLADEGDGNWELPSIAIAGTYAFWQILPNSQGSNATSNSLLKKARVGSKSVETVWESKGRMATSPYTTDNRVIITPRADKNGSIYYQLTALDVATNDVVDFISLPTSMKPLEAGYSNNGFTFAFDAIYDNETGIANLGTYAPETKATGDNYSNVPWFRWARTPRCAPANCGDFLIVKSTSAVCGVNMDTKTYFALDVETGSADYGDMLASAGSRNTFVTYANVVSKPLEGESTQYCHVRVWTAL